ncbi:MAG: acyl carrier protein [Methylococcales bacterium]
MRTIIMRGVIMGEDVIDRLKHIIAEQLDVNIGLQDIDADAPILEGGLGLDSIAIVEFITAIEESFGIQFADDDLNLKPFQNLVTLAKFICDKQASPTPFHRRDLATTTISGEPVND